MKRALIPVFGLLLTASLVLSAAAGGYLRTAHEIARAGQSDIVICGEFGTRTITLDRNGNPVEPAPSACGHCSDCTLAAFAVLPQAMAGGFDATRPDDPKPDCAQSIRLARFAGFHPRGPPVRKSV